MSDKVLGSEEDKMPKKKDTDEKQADNNGDLCKVFFTREERKKSESC